MLRYIAYRLLFFPLVLLVLVTLSFFLIRAAPGDPMADDRGVAPEIHEAMRAKYKLDQPLHVQYTHYVGNLLRGDLGLSTSKQDYTVNEIVAEHLPISLMLGVVAMMIALLFGVGSGIIAAMRQNTLIDYSAMAVAMVGISTPTFVIGPLAMLVFAVFLGWFPTSGWPTTTQLWHTGAMVGCSALALAVIWAPEYPRALRLLRLPLSLVCVVGAIAAFGAGRQMVLPAATLALPFMARISRLARTGMLEVIRQEFIKTARAKGVPEPTVITRHALRGALLPVISYLGPACANILVGSLVIERVFVIPGIGTEFVNSAFNRDYGLVLGLVVVYGTMLVVFNLLVDLAYSLLDPRIAYD